MFKKGNNIFSLLIIILSIFMTSSVNIVNADSGNEADTATIPINSTKSNTATHKDWGDSLITLVQLQDLKGNKLTEFTQNQSMQAYWEFSTNENGTNQVIHNGDTMVVTVPEQLALSNADTADVFEKGTSTVIGESVLDPKSRTITITFNSTAEKLSQLSTPVIGSFWVNVSWDVNNTDFSKEINLDWTSQGTANNNNSTGTVNVKPSLPGDGEVLYKYGGFDGNIIHWTVRVNYKQDSITDAIYKDTIGPNQVLLNDANHKIVAYPTTFDKTTGKKTDDTSNGSVIKSLSTDSKGFTASLGDIDQTIMLYYDTQITNTDDLSTSYGNTGDLLSKKTEIQNVPVNIATNKLGSDAGAFDDITSVTGHKLWNIPEGTDKPKDVTIDLLANGIKKESQTVSADNDWFYEFTNLPAYDGSQKIKYTVQEESVTGFTSTPSTTNYDITNTLTPDKTKFTVTKVWNDGKAQDDHDPITIAMYNGNHLRPKNYPDDETLSKDNNWTFTYTDLPTLTNDRWYVSESNIPSGYISTDSYNYGNDYDKVVTNTLATTLTVNKVWDNGDNKDITNPTEVKVQLYSNDNGAGDVALGDPITLSKDNNWTYEFGSNNPNNTDSKTNQLPKYDKNNKEIKYTAKEVDVPTNYTDSYDTQGTNETITNKYNSTPTDSKRNFTVKKVWSDTDSTKRPNSITVQLTANDTPQGDPVTLKPDADGKWSEYTWTNLDKNDADGKSIKYSVTEGTVDNYTSKVDLLDNDASATITNTATKTPVSDKTTFKVTKDWSDNNNTKRPTKVQVQLLANGEKSGDPVTLNKGNSWSYTWDNLDKQANNKDIVYTVEEPNVPDEYSSNVTYDKTNKNIATITNTLSSTSSDDSTHLSVTKSWNDNNNQDNIRPDNIQVQLLTNGKATGDPITLNNDNNWSHDFTGLDKANTYSVQEVKVPDGYSSTIKNIDDTNYQITNTHTPSSNTHSDTTYLSVNKIWNDINNQDKIRPNKVTVHLLKNGQVTGNAVILNSDNNWSYTWNNLSKDDNYTIQEDSVSGYATSQSKTDNKITITNTHTPGNPNMPGNPDTPDNPGNPETPLIPGTPNIPGTPDTTTFNPDNPLVPSVPYEKTPSNDYGSLLPQTGSKAANILYTVVGILLLSLIVLIIVKRRMI